MCMYGDESTKEALLKGDVIMVWRGCVNEGTG